MPQAPDFGRQVSQLLFEGPDIGRMDDVGQRSLEPRKARILRPLGRLVLSGADWCRLPFNRGDGCLEHCNLFLEFCNLGALGACGARIG
jgi:hypothetical protein